MNFAADGDIPQLRSDSLAALQEFLHDKMKEIEAHTYENAAATQSKETLFENDLAASFPEDWQMSQFWYDDFTSDTLAKEVMRQAGATGKIACLSCPSVFRACKGAKNAYLFEYDRRFQAFGSAFLFYDYNNPDAIPRECHGAYSVIIADPPFLSEECLTKLAEAVRLLRNPHTKIILCTGVVMTEKAEQLLNLRRTSFRPQHKNNLGNDFACFANYEMIM